MASKPASWFIYIIETDSGALYTGITTDLARRFHEHQYSSKGAKFFRTSKANKILWIEKAANRSVASKREAEIKKMDRRKKLELILAQPAVLCMIEGEGRRKPIMKKTIKNKKAKKPAAKKKMKK